MIRFGKKIKRQSKNACCIARKLKFANKTSIITNLHISSTSMAFSSKLIKCLFSFLIVALPSGVFAQSTMSSSADFNENQSFSLSWTIGEWIISTESDASNTLSQGFHQSKLTNIVSHPAAETFACEGDDPIVLDLVINEYEPISYQWYNSSGLMVGENSSELSLETIIENSDTYYCIWGSFMQGYSQSQNAEVVIFERDTTINEVVCLGQNYTYPDGFVEIEITANTSHVSYLNSSRGCDSIITTNLFVEKNCGVAYETAVTNVNISQDTCFNAFTTITVAGDGNNVTIESTSSARFIAEESVLFLPGFHAEAGSYVEASITTSGDFCEQATRERMVYAEQTIEKSAIENEDRHSDVIDIKVYPNPSNGIVIIEGLIDEQPTKVQVINSIGQKVLDTQITGASGVIDLSTQYAGVYFIQIMNEKRDVFRIIKL